MSYSCLFCNYYTNNKYNFNKHTLTNKHILNEKKNHTTNKKQTKNKQFTNILGTKTNNNDKSCYIINDNTETIILCKYCNKTFTHKNSMYRHIKYTCNKSKDEDLKELVRLMNLQLEKKDKEIQTLSKQMNKQNKQIEKLMNKLQVNTNIIQNNIIQNNNIQLLAYSDTDTSFLTDTDYISCLKKVTLCVKHMIEKIHFNPSNPQNNNIYISNMRDKYIMIYDGYKWILRNKEQEIDNLYETKEMMIEEWLDEEQHKYPTLRDKFIKYLNNKENDENMNLIKEEIKLMMYNNKQLKIDID